MLTPDTLTPSADIAKAMVAPKMRFLYPLAAVALAAVFLTPSAGDTQTSSAKLRSDQQKASALTDTQMPMMTKVKS